MEEVTKDLKYYLEQEIHTAINMCLLIEKKELLRPLSIILAKCEYFGYWKLIADLKEIEKEIL